MRSKSSAIWVTEIVQPGNRNSLVFQFLLASCWFKSRCSTVNPVWQYFWMANNFGIISLDLADVVSCSLCYWTRNLAGTAAGSIVWRAAEDSYLVCLLGLAALRDGSASSGDSTSGMYDFSNQRNKTVWKSAAIITYFYALVLISDRVIMWNNYVINGLLLLLRISTNYYVLLTSVHNVCKNEDTDMSVFVVLGEVYNR